jgi:AcrR family transcriptional regulator
MTRARPSLASTPRHLTNLAADRRDAIVEVASAEFVERGFAGGSMNRIIAEAGISKGSMYHFFESKADLFAVSVSAVIERMEAATGAPPTGCPDLDTFRIAFRRWYRSLLAYLAAHRDDDALLEVLRTETASPQPPEAVRRCGMQIASWYAVLFGELARLGALRDDIPGDILAGAVERATLAVDRWFIEEIRSWPSRLDELADAGTDLFLRLVSP